MSVALGLDDDPFGDRAHDPAPAPQDAPEAPEEPVEVVDRATGEILVPRGGPIAGGRRDPIKASNPLPEWASADPQDYGDAVDEQIDYSDLAAVNRDLMRLRVRLNRARRGMRAAAREAVEAKLTYQRALRRALVQQSGGSAESRKANAELLCEDLEAEMVMRAQVADEYSSVFRSVRDDIENTKTIAYNLRSLMNMV